MEQQVLTTNFIAFGTAVLLGFLIGVGASHQTGWTGLVAWLLKPPKRGE